MSQTKEYTLEIYKADKRTKEGRRLCAKQDFAPVTSDYIQTVAEQKRKQGFIVDFIGEIKDFLVLHYYRMVVESG